MSFWLRARNLSCPNSIFDSNGVSVMATISDMNSETMKAIPSGFSMRPSIPDKKKSGMNDTMMMRVALKMELRISEEAWNTTLKRGCCSSGGLSRFCRSRL